MSINIAGKTAYKKKELMKLTKALLVERLLDVNKILDELYDSFKFDPGTAPYQWEAIERGRKVIHA